MPRNILLGCGDPKPGKDGTKSDVPPVNLGGKRTNPRLPFVKRLDVKICTKCGEQVCYQCPSCTCEECEDPATIFNAKTVVMIRKWPIAIKARKESSKGTLMVVSAKTVRFTPKMLLGVVGIAVFYSIQLTYETTNQTKINKLSLARSLTNYAHQSAWFLLETIMSTSLILRLRISSTWTGSSWKVRIQR